MINRVKFPLALSILIVAAVSIMNELEVITSITRNSVFYACSVAVLNFFAFYFLIEFSFDKSNKTFLIVNLGGMGVRVCCMLLLVFLIIKFLKVDEFEFIFTFFLLYFLFLVYEIMILKTKIDKQSKKLKNTENVV